MPLAGRTLGVQRRLSRLYNDTKKSSDFVKDPVQSVDSDPEIKSLHRKLRIQKDRLVSWGLEWSDPSQQASAELLIDPSLNKAGLSEVVGSIMSTIKDILAEAEPLWHSSRRLAGEHVDPEQAAKRGEKIQLVVWDKPRFEDLVRDLTTSIDTLYDLSRTRSSYAQSSAAARERMSKSSSSAEDLRPFESSRIHTPQQIDPATLTNLRAIQAVPMTELAERERRDVVFMDRQAYATLMQGLGGQQSHAPLLLEYATFDSIYSLTGISPPMDRFGKLSAGLQAESPRVSASWTGLPRLLGYFEDMDNSRFGLVYQFPKTFNPVTFEHLTQNPLYNLCSLTDLLVRPDFEPKLEAKFRLAANLANTVFDLHSRGITHGNLLADNVSFCNAVGTDPEVSGITQGEVDIRRPLVSAFDLFSDPMSQDEPKAFSLYKHPLDPRNSSQSPLASHADSKTFDLYSLAMILLSVGLWTKLEDLVPSAESPTIPESVLEKLAIRCGTLYMKAVQACWNAVDQEVAGSASADRVASRAQVKASRYLEACCILDGVSNLEERLGDDFGEPRPDPARLSTASAASITLKNEKSVASSTQTTKEATETPPVVPAIEPVVDVQSTLSRWQSATNRDVDETDGMHSARHRRSRGPKGVDQDAPVPARFAGARGGRAMEHGADARDQHGPQTLLPKEPRVGRDLARVHWRIPAGHQANRSRHLYVGQQGPRHLEEEDGRLLRRQRGARSQGLPRSSPQVPPRRRESGGNQRGGRQPRQDGGRQPRVSGEAQERGEHWGMDWRQASAPGQPRRLDRGGRQAIRHDGASHAGRPRTNDASRPRQCLSQRRRAGGSPRSPRLVRAAVPNDRIGPRQQQRQRGLLVRVFRVGLGRVFGVGHHQR
jgi:hypothetical protein